MSVPCKGTSMSQHQMTMAQSLHALGVHIVFSTKRRHPFLTNEFRSRAHGYLATILRDMECRAVTVGGVEDHVHILCLMTKVYSSSELLKKVKQESSKVIKTFDGNLQAFSWQGGYGLFSVSPRDFEVVRNYVSNQEEHHQRERETFQDEFRRMLNEANLEFDERYVWD